MTSLIYNVAFDCDIPAHREIFFDSGVAAEVCVVDVHVVFGIENDLAVDRDGGVFAGCLVGHVGVR